MQDQAIATKSLLAVKIAIAFYVLFSVMGCYFVFIPHLMHFRHYFDLIADSWLLLYLVAAGWGLVKRQNFARVFAMCIFALVGFAFGLNAFLTLLDGSPNVLFEMVRPRYLQILICFLIFVVSSWSFWVLARKSVRELFQPATM